MQSKASCLTVCAAVALTAYTCARAVGAESSGVVRIENQSLAVEFNSQDLSFLATSRGSGARFIERGTLQRPGAAASRQRVTDPVWGQGEAIRIEQGAGGYDRFTLFSGLPFIVFESTVANGSDANETAGSIRPVSMTLGLSKEASGLLALGTAGLTGVARESNPGSYSFLAVADPESRRGVVAGWLTHERGSGLLFSDVKDGKAVIDAQLDYGQLLVKPGQKVQPEMLLIGYFDDARLGLEAYADAIARHYRIKLLPQPTVYCTWYHAGASNERDLLKNAEFAREHLVPFGFSVVQIDDGWQAGEKLNGPRKDFTKLSPDRLHLLQRSMPAHGLKARPVDLLNERIPRVWLLTDDRRTPRRDVIGLFNWEEKDRVHISCPLERIGLPKTGRYVGFDYWADEFVAPFEGLLESELPPASCRILAVRPVSGQPRVIGTSRHITQGMVDILEETWDETTQQLSGASRVVANDPYEIRIAAIGTAGAWQATGVTVSAEDAAAGVKIRLTKQEDWRVRVRIDSATSRDIHWTIQFASARHE